MKTKKILRRFTTTFCLSLALLACAPLAQGQIFNYWALPAGSPAPYAPLVLGTNGLFYGTLPGAGGNSQGEIFSADTNGNIIDQLDFGNANGNQPQAPLIQASDGNFYGTTLLTSGGEGTVFQWNADSGMLQTLANFGYTANTLPYGGLTEGCDGMLYGVTFEGGYPATCTWPNYTNGTVYRIDKGGITLSNLVAFTYTNALSAGTDSCGYNVADGAWPYYVQLVQATNGYFYGTCYQGGSSDLGTIFMMDTNGVATTLVEFAGANGGNPFTGLIQASDGNLYGTTLSGGTHGDGTIYQMTLDGTLTTLVNFDGGSTLGAGCYSSLMQWSRDGLIYGQSEVGGSDGVGEVWAMDLAGNVTRVYSYGPHFPNDGYYPHNGLTAGPDGNIWGLCTFGGANGGGSLFQIVPVAPTVVSATCPVTNSSQVILVYSESVQAATATNPANYSVNFGGPVTSVLRNSATTVTLQLSSNLASENANTLTINNVNSTIGAVPIAAATQVAINVPAVGSRLEYNQAGANFLVLEAEDYNLNQPNGTRAWNFTTSPVYALAGYTNTDYSGTGVMEADPANGSSVGASTAIGSAPSSPRLDYLVNFTNAGTFYVWVRGAGNSPVPWLSDTNAGGSDSVSIGLDGGLTTRIENFPLYYGYQWSDMQTTNHPSENITITTPGAHVINAWIRATGFAMDKLMLTDSSTYTPTDQGPAESPRYVTPFSVSFAPSGSNFTLTYPAGGTLLWSANAAGPYQPVVGAASPYLIVPTNPAAFYRVSQ